MLRYITLLLDRWTFLGLKGGFWFVAMPLLFLIIYSNICIRDKEKEKLNSLTDFNPIGNGELPVYNLEFKINESEKWKIGQVLSYGNYNNIDSLVQDLLKEINKNMNE